MRLSSLLPKTGNQHKINFEEIKTSVHQTQGNPGNINEINSNTQIGNTLTHVNSSTYFLRENLQTQKTPFYLKDTNLNLIYEDREYSSINGKNFSQTSGSKFRCPRPNKNSFERNPTFKQIKEGEKIFKISSKHSETKKMDEEENEEITTINNDKFMLGSFKSGITETFGFHTEEIVQRKHEETRSEIGKQVKPQTQRNSKTPRLVHKRRITRENFLQFMKANGKKSNSELEKRELWRSPLLKENSKYFVNNSKIKNQRMKSIGVSMQGTVPRRGKIKLRERSVAIMQTVEAKKKKNKQKIFFHQNTMPVKPHTRRNRGISLSIKNNEIMLKKLKKFQKKIGSVKNSMMNDSNKFRSQRGNNKLSLTKINIDFSKGKIGFNIKPKTAKSSVFRKTGRSVKNRSSLTPNCKKTLNSNFFKKSKKEKCPISESLYGVKNLMGMKNNLQNAIGAINNTLKKMKTPQKF